MEPRAEQSIPALAGMAMADTINEKYSSFCHRIALCDVILSSSQPRGLKTENEMELLCWHQEMKTRMERESKAPLPVWGGTCSPSPALLIKT